MNHAMHTMVMSDDRESLKGGAQGKKGARVEKGQG